MRQRDDVARSVAERREHERRDVQAIVEIFTKAPEFDGFLEVRVGRGDDPHVDGDGLSRAHADHFTFLQDPQQLDLHGRG